MGYKGQKVPKRIPDRGEPGSYERAAELGRLGGKANCTDRTVYRNTKYCTDNCPYYERCPAITASLAINVRDYEWSKSEQRWIRLQVQREVPESQQKKHPCFHKCQPQEIQNDFRNLYERQEEGLTEVIMDILYRYLSQTRRSKTTMKELKESIETAIAAKEAIYGKISKVEHTGSMPVRIVIEQPKEEIDVSTSIKK
jgi:hypothetical protein